jgi:hypothetical protein
MLNDPFTGAIHANHVHDTYLTNAERYRQAQDLKKIEIDTEPTMFSRVRAVVRALNDFLDGSLRNVEAAASS